MDVNVAGIIGKRIAVALSGGVDSMTLLDILLKKGCSVAAVNVEHGLRGEESLEDSRFAAEYCKERGVKIFLYSVKAKEYAEKEGVSIELAARILRYGIFDKLLSDGVFDAIALAHHTDDQAETVIMRLLRGSGLRGLRGITDREGYIHPLLCFTKKEITEYAAENGIPYRTDGTNYDSAYTRNFLRNEVMPLIETRFPSFNKNIYRSSLVLAETEDYLLSEVTKAREENGAVYLPLSALSRHPAIAKKSVAEAFRLFGIDKDIEYSHLEAVYALKDGENNARLNMPFGMDVIKEYAELAFVKRTEAVEYEKPFNIDEVYRFFERGVKFVRHEGDIIKGVFDLDKIPEGAVVRTRREGDTFKKFAGGTKTLSDYLTDIKLSKRERDGLLVIAQGSRVLAILGGEISDTVRITEKTERAYRAVTESD